MDELKKTRQKIKIPTYISPRLALSFLLHPRHVFELDIEYFGEVKIYSAVLKVDEASDEKP
jgi:hypothetical protein